MMSVVMILVVVILIVFAVYVLFISRSKTLGKFLYMQGMKLEKKLASLQSEVLLVDDIPITFYRNSPIQTNKPTLLLLHGFSADKSIWHRFARQAKNDYNLIIPDLLGHGETPYSKTQSYSTLQQTKMLMKLMSQLHIQKYSVIGNSMGGMIAMHLLRQDAERVSKAILLDPAGAKTTFAIEREAIGLNPFLMPKVSHFFEFYNNSMHKLPFAPPSVLHYIGETNYVKKYEQLKHMFTDFFNLDEFFSEPLGINANKLKIIWGEKDQLLPVVDAEFWQRITGCTPDIYPNIGHMPMVEAPKATYFDCRQFLLGEIDK